MKSARVVPELGQVVQLDVGVRFASRGARAFAYVADKDEWIAGEIGVSRCYVSQLKSGKRRPSLDVANAIEARFHIPPRWWKVDVAGSNAHPLDDAGAEAHNGK
jgi:DNA-binding XRE family transcriptional regulator